MKLKIASAQKKILMSALLLVWFAVPSLAQDDDFSVGGAVRFNVLSEFYEGDKTTLNTKATWDTWRLNIDHSAAGVDLSFEYRFYPTFNTHFIHHGFLGYEFDNSNYLEIGVTQVPFGITTWASHSWWFQGPYYVGLEDDYDMGINFDIKSIDNLKLSLSYFRQAEPQGPAFGSVSWAGPGAGAGRYSYDIVPGNATFYNTDNDNLSGSNESVSASLHEINQFNVRAAYNVSENVELGLSGQLGGIYNSALDESTTSVAFAAHTVADFGNFNFKGEYIYYNYKAKDDNGNDLDVVPMGAYGSKYPVATKSSMYVAGLAYSINVDMGPISNIQPYIDYTLIDKANEDFYNTQHLVPGFLISAGSIWTYVDVAFGKNQPWLTSDFGRGLGVGDNTEGWNARFNINIGYYF